MFACENNDYLMVELLLKNGANPLLKDSNSIDAVQNCRERRVSEMFKKYKYNPPNLKDEDTQPTLSKKNSIDID